MKDGLGRSTARDGGPGETPGRGPIRVPIREESDVAIARQCARELAMREGFREAGAAAIATAVSEVARNIIVHAGSGELLLAVVKERGRRGVSVVARDDAPGIPNLEEAMRDGYSTARGLGLGLPSAQRLMDDFSLTSAAGRGTIVTMKKWTHELDE